VSKENAMSRLVRVIVVIALAGAAFCPSVRASAWELDPAATQVAFSVRNLSMAHVDGHFRLTSGHVTLVEEDPSRSTVEAVIDATSVDTGEPKRDRHLRSADFLDVDHHPRITFRSTRIEQVGDAHWKVTGALTILDATRALVLDVQGGAVHGSRADAHASVTIDRRDFGMTYAGFAVGKEVAITIDAVGVEERSAAGRDDTVPSDARSVGGFPVVTFDAHHSNDR
jgi:polyisoprenoid-binding protein YceI